MARRDSVWQIRYSTYIETSSDWWYDILVNWINRYLNFNDVSGTSWYWFRDNAGVMEYKNDWWVRSIFSWWGGWWTVDSIVPWTNIDVDSTDPANPIVTTTPSGSDKQLQFNDWGVLWWASWFVWDKTTSRVGVGTTVPQQELNVVWSSNTSWFQIRRWTTTTSDSANFWFRISTADGADMVYIRAVRTNLPNSWDTAIDFGNTKTSALSTSMRIDSNWFVGIGTTAPTHTLTLPSTSTGFAMYNTADQTTNTEKIIFRTTSNRYEIVSCFAWTGSLRTMRIGIAGSAWNDAAARYLEISSANTLFNFADWTSSTSRIMIASSLISTSASWTVTSYSAPFVTNQTGTAGWTIYHANITGTDWGSWAKRFIDFYNQWVSKFYVDNNWNWVFAWSATVVDEAYDATGWDGDLTVPTKNAIRDKIESMSGGWVSQWLVTATASWFTYF